MQLLTWHSSALSGCADPANWFQVAEKGAECMSLLGLGDVVLPGLFIALILRFDENRKPGSRTYFYTVLVAYLIGLAATYVAMVWSEHAQPGKLSCCVHLLVYRLIRLIYSRTRHSNAVLSDWL